VHFKAKGHFVGKQALLVFFFLMAATPYALGGATDFGTTGLIKMPDARMEADGALRATIALDDVANIYNVTFQALPKVQATFRYSVFDPTRARSVALDGNRDRSYGVKSQFLSEARWYPAMAIGVRDILGTGIWEGEYLVATKAFSHFDATIGIGWGRLGSRSGFSNPLGVISDKFEERPAQTGGSVGGESRGASFFRGDVSVFGGLSYRFARAPLTLIAEYESDQYDREVRLGTVEKSSAWNFGLSWEPWSGINLRGSWLRGDTLGLTFSTQMGTKSIRPRREEKRAVPQNVNAETGFPEGYDPTSWYDRMLFATEQSGLYLKSGSLQANERKASMVIENREYNLTADAVYQVASLSERLMPARVRSVDILLEDEGLSGPTVNYTLQRLVDVPGSQYGSSASDSLKILAPRDLPRPTNTTDYGYPSLAFGVDLAAKVQLMDPDDPARKQVYAKLTGRLQLSNHTNLWMRYEQNLYNDFTTSRPASSVLPNVRTQVARYLVDGESGIEQLYAEHKNSVSPSVHTRVYVGILEAMYGGVGGEVLYSPYKQRWALGLAVNAVKQREFERNFKFRDYETVTAHVSAYYASPFYNVDLAVHIGRYLAEDRGYTFEARRTFDSGFSLGGFFTRTNVSAEDFGEGSFDKGVFFRIPFDGILPGNTRAAFSTILRPLERDGGRRLENFGGSLWFDRRSLRYDALDGNRARMLPR
jgi:hypothetical protein